MTGDEQDVIGVVDQQGTDQLVLFAETDRDDAALAVGVVLGQARLLHQAVTGREHQVVGHRVVADVEHLRDVLVRLQGEEVRDVLSLRIAAGLRHLVRLRAVDTTLVREEQQPMVRRRDEEVLDDVVRPQLRALDSLAAAVLRAIVVAASALDVALARDGDDHLLFGDEVFHRDVAVEALQHVGATVVAEALDDAGQLVADDRALAGLIGEDRLEVRDLELELGGLIKDLLRSARRCRSARRG